MTEEQVFLAALDLPDEAARATYLNEACGEGTAFRRQVEALLANHFRSGEFLNVPAAEQIEIGAGANYPVTIQSEVMTANKSSADDESDDLSFLEPSTRPDSLGRIGHYEVLQVLGKGGFGIVFRAFDDVLQRVVAIKVMAPQLAATSPARRRFLREARTSAGVRHENVVQVYEVGEQPLPHLAMEFIPGETLQQRLDRTGPLDVQETLRIGRQIAEGLAAAHATDLIHRDIKPGNVLLEGGQQKVKITDFGLARAADDASMTQSGTIAGTPMYMAPEQALGHPLDQRADLFSLGSVLYQMVAGRPPFRAGNTVAVLKRVAEDTPRNIREVIPETPQWLCDIIAKLHAKKPEERFQSAREVADVLADCEMQLAAHQKLQDYARIPVSRPAAPRTGRQWNWAIAAATGLLLFGSLMFYFFGGAYVFSDRGRLYLLNMGEVQIDEFHLAPFETFILTSDTAPEFVQGAPLPPHVPLFVESGTYHIKTVGKNQEQAQVWEIRSSREKGEAVTRQEGEECTLEIKRGEQVRVSVAKWEPAPAPDASWVQLFNGKDLTGWKKHPLATGDWSVEDGVIVGRGDISFLFNESKEYGNFHLRVETKINNTGDSGVFFRVPFDERVSEGYEAQIAVRSNYPVHTGSLLSRLDPSSPLQRARLMPHRPDEWFVLEVIADGNHLQTRVNGLITADYHDDKQAIVRGHIALGTWGENITVVQFRKIEIKELPPEEPGFVPLFNGHDLDGWSAPTENWRVQEGLLIGKDTGSLLGGDYENFHCRIRAKCDPYGWGGFVFRITPTGNAEIGMGHRKGGRGTGALIFNNEGKGEWLSLPEKELAPPGSWYDLDVLVRGKHILVKVNGVTTVDRTLAELPGRGQIRLSTYQAGTVLQVEKIEIKELPATETAQPPTFTNMPEVKTPAAVARFPDADVERIDALPAIGQVAEVRKELMRRNPGFDGNVVHTIENDVVTELRINSDQVADIAPIRVWRGLRVLDCRGTYDANYQPNGLLADLTPLEGMDLAELTHLYLNNTKITDAGFVCFKDCKALRYLDVSNTKVTDGGLAHFQDCTKLRELHLWNTKLTGTGLAHFKNCQDLATVVLNHTAVDDANLAHLADLKSLTSVELGYTQISDEALTWFKDCKALTRLYLHGTQVSDAGLADLKGLPLTLLWIDATGITDLTPLQGMPLEDIRLTPQNITRGMDILRDMKSLKTIGIQWDQSWPAAEFWERYDKGEFAIAR
jgi:serine/threonine protein kinase/Leucine-rich repeat (LRR) protein